MATVSLCYVNNLTHPFFWLTSFNSFNSWWLSRAILLFTSLVVAEKGYCICERALFCFAFNKPYFCHHPHWSDLQADKQPASLNLTIMMSSRRLERVQTAEILHIKEHKPETRPRSTGLLSVFSDLMPVLLLYINTCKCHVTHYRLPPSLSLSLHSSGKALSLMTSGLVEQETL